MSNSPEKVISTRASLLSRLKHWDDQKSWQDFYDIYSRLIYGAAIKTGLSESEVEDVVQDTIIAVSKAIREFKYQPENCSFKTWLHSITRRQVANQFRKRQGRVLEPLPTPDGDDAESRDIPDPASQALDTTWERDWEQNLFQAATDRVKRRVSPAQFQIFEYLMLQDHTVSETARTLNISAGKVYLAKHRISAQIKSEVAYLRTKYV